MGAKILYIIIIMIIKVSALADMTLYLTHNLKT